MGAIGTVLSGGGPALGFIKASKPFYGSTLIFNVHYMSGYELIKDASGAIIGLYFVGVELVPFDPNDL